MHIWQKLKTQGPIFIQAPMEEAGDSVFRQILAQSGRPDLFFTEFTNVEGLVSKGRQRIIHRLQHTATETPLIAQIWGQHPDNFYTVANQLQSMGFAGIDLNMGCPERKIVKRGCCSGLIGNQQLAGDIIEATKAGAGPLPVSVKTRCGINKWITEDWISFLLHQDVAAITLHGRIASEMSHFPAKWDEIAKAVPLRNHMAPHTILIGNGDVDSRIDGLQKIRNYGLDGVMIGRALLHNPWLFSNKSAAEISTSQRLTLLLHHLQLFTTTWGPTKNFQQMRRYYKMYLNTPELADTRHLLMTIDSPDQTIDYVQQLVDQISTH